MQPGSSRSRHRSPDILPCRTSAYGLAHHVACSSIRVQQASVAAGIAQAGPEALLQ